MTTLANLPPDPRVMVLLEVLTERVRQDQKHGVQDLPDGTGAYSVTPDGVRREDTLAEVRRGRAQEAQDACDRAFTEGRATFRHVLEEEVREAFAEDEPAKLRAELVQVAAVAVKWIEAIGRRSPCASP